MSYLKEHDDHGEYSFQIVYVSSYLGTIELTECTSCGYLYVLCEHEKNSWVSVGHALKLICDLCGSDGTC